MSSFGASAGGARNSASRRPLRGAKGTFGARRDGQALSLPAVVDLWPERADNHALHLWLAAFFAHLPLRAAGPPAVVRDISLLRDVRAATAATLAAAPGLKAVHAKLCMVALASRARRTLPPAEAAVDEAVRALLGESGARAFDLACEKALAAGSRKLSPVRPGAAVGRGGRLRRRRAANGR